MSSIVPLVTVYVVSHNYGKYLEQAIESVLKQNYQNWELLLIDDGSSDETSSIMRLYIGDPRIRLFRTDGIGLPSVANLALENSNGKYVIRLDGDDIFDENILLVLTSYLENNPRLALVFSDYYLIDEFGLIFAHERRHKISEMSHLSDMPPNGACTCIRKSVLLELGGYREDLGAQDGFDIWSKIRNTHLSMNVNLPLFYYRRHESNLTNNSYRVLVARRQIKIDAIQEKIKNHRPILAVIPCRKNYDFRQNLWSINLNGKSLLKRKIDICLRSSLFDKVIVASDTNEVCEEFSEFKDSRLEFFEREFTETLRSRSITGTLSRIVDRYDQKARGITTLCYVPSPFVSLDSMEEAISTLIFNDADSSIGVEEIKDPVFSRTAYGLKMINNVSNLRTDHDVVYREANIAFAGKNKNFRLGTLIGAAPINFIVPADESFFIDSELKLNIAHILDSK